MFWTIQNCIIKKEAWGNGKKQLFRTQQNHISKSCGQSIRSNIG